MSAGWLIGRPMTAPDRTPAAARKPAAGRTPFAPPPCDPQVAARRLSRLRRARDRTGGAADRRRLLGAERPRVPQGQRGGAGAGGNPARRGRTVCAAQPRPRRRGRVPGAGGGVHLDARRPGKRAGQRDGTAGAGRPDDLDRLRDGSQVHVQGQRVRPSGVALAPGPAAPAGPVTPGPRQRDHPVQGPAAGRTHPQPARLPAGPARPGPVARELSRHRGRNRRPASGQGLTIRIVRRLHLRI